MQKLDDLLGKCIRDHSVQTAAVCCGTNWKIFATNKVTEIDFSISDQAFSRKLIALAVCTDTILVYPACCRGTKNELDKVKDKEFGNTFNAYYML